MRHELVLAFSVATSLLSAGVPSRAEDQSDAGMLAGALSNATVLLEQGLQAGSSEGTPISARYEIEDGILQLSVYTMNRDQFSEIIVDRRSGAIDRSEAITEGEGLKAAAAQGSAMSRARLSIAVAVGNALRAAPGYRAISVVPMLDNGHPVAVTTLVKDQHRRKVIETLD